MIVPVFCFVFVNLTQAVVIEEVEISIESMPSLADWLMIDVERPIPL